MTKGAILAGAALLALAGCGNNGAGSNNSADANVAITVDNAAGTAAPANAADAVPPAAGNTASTGPAPTRDYVVGRWTDTGNCADAIDFQADGTLVGPGGGGQTERWELNGNQLAMVGNPMPLTVAVVDQNTMDTTNTQGRTRRVTRCQ